MIFEASLIGIATFVLVYLRGKTSSLNIPMERVPEYAIFVITSGYPLLKIIWFIVLFFIGRREIEVSQIELVIILIFRKLNADSSQHSLKLF